MPEYLAPGVYIEEVSFRQKTIEGVSTSTAGFVGPARFGPTAGEPVFVTNFGEFERAFGGLDALVFGDAGRANYLAQGVRAFFEEGGRRLYLSRIFRSDADAGLNRSGQGLHPDGIARAAVASGSPPAPAIGLEARHPGAGGNLVVFFVARASENLLGTVPRDPSDPASTRVDRVVRGLRAHDVVRIASVGASPPSGGQLYRAERYFDELLERTSWRFVAEDGSSRSLERPGDVTALDPAAEEVRLVTASVEVQFPGFRPRREVWDDLALDPGHERSLSRVFGRVLAKRDEHVHVPLIFDAGGASGPAIGRILFGAARPADEAQRVALLLELDPDDATLELSILSTLDDDRLTERHRTRELRLTGGNDGVAPSAREYEGVAGDDPSEASGLRVFEHVADISIVAAPGHSFGDGEDPNVAQTVRHLISHCERMRYRIAVLDAPPAQSLGDVRRFRSRVDSSHAALYYPWIQVLDPVSNQPINLPPSGAVAGIYARNDVERGVHKAPANEVLRTAIGLEHLLAKAHQDVLNPEGINCLRFFEGRGFRVWGARTVSSDGEWRYVNLRRYFAYLERSIEAGTQWAVFEPNGDRLWNNVRQTVEDFLFSEWQNDRLFGLKPNEAFFVRCDRSTMSQNDIDSGRMICLIGVAPLRPAEFVIFRIGQWTADRRG